MTRLEILQQRVSTVCPTLGVSVGRWEERTTWRLDFAPEATQEQQAAAQALIASFSLVELARSDKTTVIKAEAAQRILARCPEHKQRNTMARMLELLDKRTTTPLDATEQTELTEAKAAWAWINLVRKASNDAEALIAAATTEEAVNAVTPTWPA